MLDNIVVLLDGSELALCALPHTRALAQAFQANVTLLHVLEPKEKTDTGRLDPLNWHLRKIEAQSYLAAISQQDTDTSPPLDTVLLEGAAANRIVEYIEKNNPDLVILSSHGRGGLSPWNVSSVAQKIIYRAFRSLLLVRAYEQPEGALNVRYRRIAVLLDGSKRAECALPFAVRLAAAHNAELMLVHTMEAPTFIQCRSQTSEERAALAQIAGRNEAQVDLYLAQVAAQIQPAPVTCRLSSHNTADALLEFVNHRDIDLLATCAHGYSSETTRPYGSVVSNLIAYGRTSLLIIQDLPQDQIRPTQAEINAAATSSARRMNRTIAYAQPANWSTK
ncbi:MAG: universal stress protein [Ardenticatenaceae bacterium]|nr:universal stress protein [Ardenticatenaceae bacterium]